MVAIAYYISQSLGCVVLLGYIIALCMTIRRERYRRPLPILTWVCHRLLAMATLLQCIRHIDPNAVNDILPRLAVDLLQANTVVCTLTLVAFFVYQTVGGAYRTYTLPFPVSYRWLTYIVTIVGTIAMNLGVLLSTFLDQEKYVAVNYLSVAISVTCFVPAFVYAVVRLVRAVDATSVDALRASSGAQQFAGRAVRRLRIQMIFMVIFGMMLLVHEYLKGTDAVMRSGPSYHSDPEHFDFLADASTTWLLLVLMGWFIYITWLGPRASHALRAHLLAPQHIPSTTHTPYGNGNGHGYASGPPSGYTSGNVSTRQSSDRAAAPLSPPYPDSGLISPASGGDNDRPHE